MSAMHTEADVWDADDPVPDDGTTVVSSDGHLLAYHDAGSIEIAQNDCQCAFCRLLRSHDQERALNRQPPETLNDVVLR
jgi:hypothetical protein